MIFIDTSSLINVLFVSEKLFKVFEERSNNNEIIIFNIVNDEFNVNLQKARNKIYNEEKIIENHSKVLKNLEQHIQKVDMVYQKWSELGYEINYLEKDELQNIHDNLKKLSRNNSHSENKKKFKDLVNDSFDKRVNIICKITITNILISFMIEKIPEAKLRLENQIPPGYKDYGKEGIEKFHDYFIWASIIEYAKKSQCKDYIFITDDVKDINKKFQIKEFKEATGKEIKIMTLLRFLNSHVVPQEINETLDDLIVSNLTSQIEEYYQFLRYESKENFSIYFNEIDFDILNLFLEKFDDYYQLTIKFSYDVNVEIDYFQQNENFSGEIEETFMYNNEYEIMENQQWNWISEPSFMIK